MQLPRVHHLDQHFLSLLAFQSKAELASHQIQMYLPHVPLTQSKPSILQELSTSLALSIPQAQSLMAHPFLEQDLSTGEEYSTARPQQMKLLPLQIHLAG
jgi:hypothetical protein